MRVTKLLGRVAVDCSCVIEGTSNTAMKQLTARQHGAQITLKADRAPRLKVDVMRVSHAQG